MRAISKNKALTITILEAIEVAMENGHTLQSLMPVEQFAEDIVWYYPGLEHYSIDYIIEHIEKSINIRNMDFENAQKGSNIS
jgi:hypothetical protein